jgi:glutamate--cysteine ligase
MSDLGYTNNEQASLQICYNNLDSYLAGVKDAINLDSAAFSQIGVKVNGQYQQLNSNVLQIENELYAPIRPKQVAESGEKPSEALENRGVEYIEVRALDVNPFADTGISIEQIYFLDIFLTYCALMDSPNLDADSQRILEENMAEVVIRGRDPQLLLTDAKQKKSILQWGGELFDEMKLVAELLDKAHASDKYCLALSTERKKLDDSRLTPSAKILDVVVNQEKSLIKYSLDLAKSYREQLINNQYQHYTADYFTDQTGKSHQQQQALEAADTLNFDDFLQQYFEK